MVFNDASGGQGLCQDTDFICGTDSTSYPLADKARNANRHLYVAVTDIIKSEGRMGWSDPNLTTGTDYTFTLVNGQQSYSLPTNLLRLWALEIKDAAGNSIRLKEIDINDPVMARTITDFQNTAGTPKYYDIRGDEVFMYPAPATGSVTLTDGGKMFFSPEIDVFTAADTTQEPGIPEPSHRIISIGMALDWLFVNDSTAKYDRYKQEYEQLRAALREFFSTRNKERGSKLQPAHSVKEYI